MKSGLPTILKHLLSDILGSFVMHADALTVGCERLTNIITLVVRCHSEDAPRIIGKSGAHHKALLRVARVIGARHGMRVEVAVEAPRLPIELRAQTAWGFSPDQNWDRDGIKTLLRRICVLIFGERVEVHASDDEAQSKTVFSVWVDRMEPVDVVLAMTNDLNTIFNVVGKRRGRLLQVDVAAILEPEPLQPQSASGRHAREVRK